MFTLQIWFWMLWINETVRPHSIKNHVYNVVDLEWHACLKLLNWADIISTTGISTVRLLPRSFWYTPVLPDPAEPWVMKALPAANSFIDHLVILLMHEDFLGRPPPYPAPLESMINGVPPKLHQLASAIWYLSLQDRIDFWDIMQKMNCHVHRSLLNERW